MSCTNCFNGCAEIISDKCVKYTGVDISGLDIHTGDTLLTVENKITDKILTLMNGSGIIPILDEAEICEVVQELIDQVNCCLPLTLNDVLNVYLKAICLLNDKNEELKESVRVLEIAMNALNADYTIGCLTGVTASSDTHEIIQAVIDKLCDVVASLELYVKKTELNGLIAEYIADIPTASKHKTKMIPWVAVPFFDPVISGKFDNTGKGIAGSEWEDIYLCNGRNPGVPDLRGRVVVGATDMAGTPSDPDTIPGVNGNPIYNLNDAKGHNTVTLSPDEMPAHIHIATVAITDPGHTHPFTKPLIITNNADSGSARDSVNDTETSGTTSSSPTGITVNVTNSIAGSDKPHLNYQPSRAANFIIYIPA